MPRMAQRDLQNSGGRNDFDTLPHTVGSGHESRFWKGTHRACGLHACGGGAASPFTSRQDGEAALGDLKTLICILCILGEVRMRETRSEGGGVSAHPIRHLCREVSLNNCQSQGGWRQLTRVAGRQMHISVPLLLLPVALERVELAGSPPGRGERC